MFKKDSEYHMSKGRRIVKNTLLLYMRMLFAMFVGLYTSRVVINALGVEDYGIYNVVGGIAVMFTLLSGALSSAASRFHAFQLGKGDFDKLRRVFSISVFIHFLLAFIILIIAETAGVWFLNVKMNIPEERMFAANWVFQLSVFSFLINLISIPYNAAITAHEHMNAFAYIGILEVLLRLGAVFLLMFFDYDKLILYAFLVLNVAIIIRLIYGVYCRKNFEECKYKFTIDKELRKEMLGFAGWNFLGISSVMMRQQGVDIILNIFFGPVINAARGVSAQVNGQVGGFSMNILRAINPQIIKSYAQGDYTYMKSLVQKGARYAFYMVFVFSLPIIIETDFILKLWLKTVPEHAVLFVRLILIYSMMEALSYTLGSVFMATGKIKKYQIIVGTIQLLNLPLSYALLKIGLFPEITILVSICLAIISMFVRLWLIKNMLQIPMGSFLKKVMLNIVIVSLFSAFIPVMLHFFITLGRQQSILVIGTSLLCAVLSIYLVGCSNYERQFINSKLKQFILKKRLGWK
jgi:O-antigen/teichoic acid export membrane protein